MTTPTDEEPEQQHRLHNGPPEHPHPSTQGKTAEEEDTTAGEGLQRIHSPGRGRSSTHLTLDVPKESEFRRSLQSPGQSREQAHRFDDDLAMLHVEQQVSQSQESNNEPSRSRSMRRSRSRRETPVDDFDEATNPLHEKVTVYRPPENPNTNLGRIFKKIHGSSILVRWFLYITPPTLIILIPLLLGALLFKNATVGDVKLDWFCIWLEIVWLSLWAGRILAKCLPWPIGIITSLFTNNSKKWRDMGKQLELPATLFFWWIAIEISFLPTMNSHHYDGDATSRPWEISMNKVLISLFVGFILNFAEKIFMQLIAISFHLRTYADRIELNKFQIGSLAKLYQFSKEKIAIDDKEFEAPSGTPSGTRTPGQLVQQAQRGTAEAFRQIGDVAGKIAGDFTGHNVVKSTHPHQVVLTLLNTTSGSQVLARRLYRTFACEDTESVHQDDLRKAFQNDDEADAAFTMFDKDMNGDITMEEFEAVCVEIGRERKSITASLKDLDSVVSKLDDVFMFIIFAVTALVFISLISTSAAGVLTSAGSTVLALSWLLSATAQEFLQSIIFVFVKHPFDVGDRVTIYGNTGAQMKGDDFFVKEISLLYTEFKKMEGHVVQAPNSYLNTLFILNQRRSGGLAEAIPIVVKFGTTLDQIDGLRTKLLDFVISEKREYQPNILTELRDVTEAHSLTLNVVFFYKSNWQNELLRLQRRNKFICALMVAMQELGIEGPRMRYPGQKQSFPVYMQHVPHMAVPGAGHGGHPDNPNGIHEDPPFVEPVSAGSRRDADVYSKDALLGHHPSTLHHWGPGTRPRGESLAQMSRRLDFSLGMKDISAADMTGDVYRDRSRSRLPASLVTSSELSQDRRSQELRSPSQDLGVGRSSSVFRRQGLARVGTDSSMARSRKDHRNRFFGRRPRPLEEEELMEGGMVDIPEDGSKPSSMRRLDPRSGVFSPTAWKQMTNESEMDTVSLASGGGPRPSRAATEELEMKRL